jgi:hypothetical protein
MSISDLNLDFSRDTLYKVISIANQKVEELIVEESKDNLEDKILQLGGEDLLLISTRVIDGMYGQFNIYSIVLGGGQHVSAMAQIRFSLGSNRRNSCS